MGLTKLRASQINVDGPNGFMTNGKLVVTVTTNNLTVALKTLLDEDPSTGNPVAIRFGNNIRTITAPLSVTTNAGVNYFNSGSATLAGLEVDYFVYLGHNLTDGIVIGFSRIPSAKIYSDFHATATNEKYCAISNIATAAATNVYHNIGRFSATLSLTPNFYWSVPTYDSSNIVNRPIYETRILTFNPVWTGIVIGDGSNVATYMLSGNTCDYVLGVMFGSTTTIGTGGVNHTLPISRRSLNGGSGWLVSSYVKLWDASVGASLGTASMSTLYSQIQAVHVGFTYATHVNIATTVPFTWAVGDAIDEVARYFI